MRLVIAAVDGSQPAATASQWAARFAARFDADLVVASAWEPAQAEGTLQDFAEKRAAASTLLEEAWCEPARAVGAHPRAVLVVGPPKVLLGLADTEDADLLIVGNRGDGGPAQLHLSSVAHLLAHHATRPLAIIPATVKFHLPTRIVLGVNGSAGSHAAVVWCAEVASVLGASVVAVLAFEPFLEWVPDTDPKSWRRDAERHVEEWVAPLRARNVPVETAIVRDIHPAAAISHTAKHRGADLVVVGAHAGAPVTNVLRTGVAVQTVHHSGLPVVLVPDSTT
jgi:nucleotide-binding universal stress UspA family protein